METETILELVDIAVSLAESQLSGSALANTLADIAHRGMEAYEAHTGESLNESSIEEEAEL